MLLVSLSLWNSKQLLDLVEWAEYIPAFSELLLAVQVKLLRTHAGK